MNAELNLKEIKKEWHGSYKSYAIGFLSSILLTVISFLIAITKPFSENYLTHALIALAVIQAVFQLLFFLHVGQEAKPRLETISLGFMVLVLCIIVLGSLWIMFDLDDRVMSNMKGAMGMEMSHD